MYIVYAYYAFTLHTKFFMIEMKDELDVQSSISTNRALLEMGGGMKTERTLTKCDRKQHRTAVCFMTHKVCLFN